jgi:hypothetical protein
VVVSERDVRLGARREAVLRQLTGPDPVSDDALVEAATWLMRVLEALADCGFRLCAVAD